VAKPIEFLYWQRLLSPSLLLPPLPDCRILSLLQFPFASVRAVVSAQGNWWPFGRSSWVSCCFGWWPFGLWWRFGLWWPFGLGSWCVGPGFGW
jgi:hypothetical protein